MDLATGKTIEERYTVQGLLGRGGMASVYLVHDTRLQVDVALKVLHVPAAAIRDRLVQEGRIQAALKHPNVLNVTDIVDVDGCPGLVMELVLGPSLDVLLAHCPLGAADAEALARGILAGVRAAHGAGVIHRDLKPGNVLLARVDDGLVPKVADFGLVKLLGPEGGSGTRSGLPMGTPQYMAPEQIRGVGDIDQRADLFSLGALFYELFWGVKAFPGDDLLEVFEAIEAGAWQRPEPREGPPAHVLDAISACLEPDRDRRVASCDALLALLDAGGAAPQGAWDARTLGSVADLRPEVVSLGGSATTELGSEATILPVPETVPAILDSAPAFRRRVLLGAALALVFLVWLAPWSAEAVFRPGHPPPVQGDVQVQTFAGQAWQELLENADYDAVVHVEQALALAPSDPALRLLRATLALGLGDWDDFIPHVLAGAAAVEEPETAVGSLLLAMAPHVRVEGDMAWLVPLLQDHVAAFPDDYLGRHLWIIGMTTGSGVPFDDAVIRDQIRLFPETPTAYVGAFYARLQHQGAEQALETGLAGLEHHPGSAALEGAVAVSLLRLVRPAEALDHTRRCLRLDPGWSECRVSAAQAAIMGGDEASFRRTADLMSGEDVPRESRLAFLLMTVRTLDERGRPAQADAHLTRYRELSDSVVPTQMLLRKQSELLAEALYPQVSTPQALDARLRALDRDLAVPA